MGIALRLAIALVLATIVGSIVTFLVTRNRAYLRFGWQVFKYSVIVVLVVLFFFAIERIILFI